MWARQKQQQQQQRRVQHGCIFFRGQNAYRHGTHMCTTACMHVAVAALCNILDLLYGTHQALRLRIDSIMQLASQSQAGLERLSHPRMLSVHEIIKECGIDLPKLCIQSQELFMVRRNNVFVAGEGSSCGGSASCFIGMRELPSRLREKKFPCAALATGNGHTVCLVHYAGDKFAIFDSMPGLLAVNLNEGELLKRLAAGIGLVFSPEEDDKDCGRRQAKKKPRKGSSRSRRGDEDNGDGDDDDAHQCDVTIFWKSSGTAAAAAAPCKK